MIFFGKPVPTFPDHALALRGSILYKRGLIGIIGSRQKRFRRPLAGDA
jgi:hypothetical protein